MQHGGYVVEQVLDAQAEVFQVASGGARPVGTAPPRIVVVISDAVHGGSGRPRFRVMEAVVIAPDLPFAKPEREEARQPVAEIVRKVSDHGST